jgi:hypothetical protein
MEKNNPACQANEQPDPEPESLRPGCVSAKPAHCRRHTSGVNHDAQRHQAPSNQEFREHGRPLVPTRRRTPRCHETRYSGCFAPHQWARGRSARALVHVYGNAARQAATSGPSASISRLPAVLKISVILVVMDRDGTNARAVLSVCGETQTPRRGHQVRRLAGNRSQDRVSWRRAPLCTTVRPRHLITGT